ncbi:MAG TPA: hypothetical protein DCX07_10370 [Phycisphaerales bacterium]|nr:hypothetical protein [Phycisphaerales bacterium]
MGALLVSAPAWGQVHQQDTGNVLDANPLVGSGGANAPVGGQRINSQLYVTGQVSGLGSFRGPVGYYAPDQLNINLPSSQLSTFRRQSVGLQDLSMPTYLAHPYLDPGQTALGAYSISRGATLPGTNIPLTPYVDATVGRTLYTAPAEAYKSLMVPEGGALASPLSAPLIAPEVSLAGPGAAPASGNAPSLFGILRPKDREELAKDLYEFGAQDTRLKEALDTRTDSEITGPRETPEQTAARLETIQGRTPAKGEKTAAGAPTPHQDAFLDLLVQLGHRENGELVPTEQPELTPPDLEKLETVQPPEPPKPEKKPTETPPEDNETEAVAKPRQTPSAITMAPLVAVDTNRQVVIHALAGRGRDLFNRYMRSGESLLKRGRYYQAAEEFRQAGTIDPKNPLPLLGRATALLVAGEPISAAFNLRRGMEVYPPVMEARPEFISKAPQEDVQRAISRLDERLAGEPARHRVEMLLLAAFAHHGMGQRDQATQCARQLRDAAGTDKLAAAYAEFLLTGKRPDTRGPTAHPGGATTRAK